MTSKNTTIYTALKLRLQALSDLIQSERLAELASQAEQMSADTKWQAQLLSGASDVLLSMARNHNQDGAVTAINHLDSGSFLRDLLSRSLLLHKGEEIQLLWLLAVVLQTTSSCNFVILTFLSDNSLRLDPFTQISKGTNLEMSLETIFRLYEAQPYLKQVWDLSSIYRVQDGGIVCKYIKAMLHSETGLQTTAADQIELDKAMRINRAGQAAAREEFTKTFGAIEMDLSHNTQVEGLVITDYLKDHVKKA